MEPGNINIEDELARLVWPEKKAKVKRIKNIARLTSQAKSHIPSDNLETARDDLPSNPPSMDPSTTSPPKRTNLGGPINHLESEALPHRPCIPAEPTSKSGKSGKQKSLIQELNESPASPTPIPPPSTTPDVKAQQASHVPPSHDAQPTPVSSPYAPLQPYSQSHSARIGIPSLATLEKLVRQTPPDNGHVLYETLFNLDAGKVTGIFGKFGFDSTFLDAFIEAILFMQADPNWMTRSVSLLDSLRRCGRFSIALTFAPKDKIRKIFDGLEKGADIEQGNRIRQVKSFWIE